MNHATQAPERQICDVLVIGGGPAGSTACSMLAFKTMYFVANVIQPRRAHIRPADDSAALARSP